MDYISVPRVPQMNTSVKVGSGAHLIPTPVKNITNNW